MHTHTATHAAPQHTCSAAQTDTKGLAVTQDDPTGQRLLVHVGCGHQGVAIFFIHSDACSPTSSGYLLSYPGEPQSAKVPISSPRSAQAAQATPEDAGHPGQNLPQVYMKQVRGCNLGLGLSSGLSPCHLCVGGGRPLLRPPPTWLLRGFSHSAPRWLGRAAAPPPPGTPHSCSKMGSVSSSHLSLTHPMIYLSCLSSVFPLE